MSLPVILRPEADADIQVIHSYLNQVNAGLGDRFISRLREALERIEAMPESYAVIWMDVHAARIKKYRHLIYYIVFSDRVEIIAVMHGARDASAWQQRV